MNINCNNYEELFLLYADGELTSAEMQAVEVFTSHHPHLAEELQLLMEVVLPPEMATMRGKNRLLKLVEWNENTATPQQTLLLMYLDCELPTTQAKTLESNLIQSENLQKDWNFLQHTRLLAPAAKMANKTSLYHHTAVRKPISPRWLRLVAAAIMAGVGWFLLNDNNRPTAVLPKRASTEPTNFIAPWLKTIGTGLASINKPSNGFATRTTVTTKPRSKPAREEKAETATQGLTSTTETDGQGVYANNQTTVKTLEEFMPTVLLKTTSHPYIEKTLPTFHTQNLVTSNQITTTNPIAQTGADEYEFAREDEPEYLYIAGTKIKKQKVRAFLRTVGRTVTRGFTNGNIAQVEEQPIP